jgi:hypothetical protein
MSSSVWGGTPGRWRRGGEIGEDSRDGVGVGDEGDEREGRPAGLTDLSLVENAVFGCKTIIGQRMRSRSLEQVEVDLACKILNTRTALGMTDSVRER